MKFLKGKWLMGLAFMGVAIAAASGGFYYGRYVNPVAAKSSIMAKALAKTGVRVVTRTTESNTKAALDKLISGTGQTDPASMADWANSMNPADRAAMFAQLQNTPVGAQRNAMLQAVINSWAASDPQGFLAATDSVSSPKMREAGMDAALKAWAAQNPQDALQWLKDNPGSASTAELQGRYAAAIGGFATTDPQAAFNAVLSLDPNTAGVNQLRSQALQALTNSMADQGMYSDALSLFAQLPPGQAQNQAYNALATRWATDSPTDASAWVSTLTDPRLRATLGGQVATAWAQVDPAGAADWAAQMDQQTAADPTLQNAYGNNNLLASTVGAWASADPAAAAAFLDALPDSPDKNSAVATYALNAAQQDPADAMARVGAITDDGMRQRLAMVTALQWEQSDPDALNQYLTSNNNVLTPDQVQTLSALPPNLGRLLAGAASGAGGAAGGGLAGGGGGGGRGGYGGGGGGGNALQNFLINGTGNPFGNPRTLNAINTLSSALGGPSYQPAGQAVNSGTGPTPAPAAGTTNVFGGGRRGGGGGGGG